MTTSSEMTTPSERQALRVYQPASFLGALAGYHLAPTSTVTSPKGKAWTLHASDVYGAREKYLARVDLDQQPCPLLLLGETLVAGYQEWLTTGYTPRYCCVTTDEQRTWLEQVSTLVVARYLLERKLARFLAADPQAFADPWACCMVDRHALAHLLPSEQARLVHHILREPTREQALIEDFLAALDDRMQRHPFALPDPLPPLPAGVQLPLAFLTSASDAEQERSAS
jgi:hypothetical protein